jgi:NitT/TauT family transport system substrate-binding protein
MKRPGFARRSVCLMLAVALGGCATAGTGQRHEAIRVHGNIETFEIAPVLLAAEKYYPGPASVKMGGIPNLVGAAQIQGFGSPGVADVATHAETQALRYSVEHPDVRIILNVTRGLYRVVARKSAGIDTLADLKGKRIATIPVTSSGYFLERMLRSAGLSFSDIEAVAVSPLSTMPDALARREVDAVVIWEPYSENAVQALDGDVIEFSNASLYSEHFNLNSTAGNLADPAKRAKIVAFVRAVIDAAEEVRRDPREAQRLVNQYGKHPPEEIARSWKHHEFTANYPDDMLDILVVEEQWLASRDNRPARSREQLATLIDTSVYQEALALAR